MRTPLEDWLRKVDVLDMLDISERKLQTMRSNGSLPFARLGGKIYYKRSDIEQILEDAYELNHSENYRHELR